MDAKYVMLIVAGVMFLIGLIVVIVDRSRKARCTMVTMGTVVSVLREVDTDENGHKKHSYRPVFEYFTGTQTVRREARFAVSSSRKYRVGDVQEIRFNPDKPEEYILSKGGSSLASGILLMIAAVAIAGVTVYFSFIRK